ncbi:MAG: hypothetical protein AAGJ86_08785 [Pseudomonadota bacterium]
MSMLRDDYDPTDTPLNSSAIFRVDTSLFELDVDETPEQTSASRAAGGREASTGCNRC